MIVLLLSLSESVRYLEKETFCNQFWDYRCKLDIGLGFSPDGSRGAWRWHLGAVAVADRRLPGTATYGNPMEILVGEPRPRRFGIQNSAIVCARAEFHAFLVKKEADFLIIKFESIKITMC